VFSVLSAPVDKELTVTDTPQEISDPDAGWVMLYTFVSLAVVTVNAESATPLISKVKVYLSGVTKPETLASTTPPIV
jgi:hypothetical protein